MILVFSFMTHWCEDALVGHTATAGQASRLARLIQGWDALPVCSYSTREVAVQANFRVLVKVIVRPCMMFPFCKFKKNLPKCSLLKSVPIHQLNKDWRIPRPKIWSAYRPVTIWPNRDTVHIRTSLVFISLNCRELAIAIKFSPV